MTCQEAVAAIQADFRQYAPQTRLFIELFPLVFGSRSVISGTHRENHLWMVERGRKMVRISPRDLGTRIGQELEQALPSVDVLAAICRRVFRTEVRPGECGRSKEPGLWVLTGMEDFQCRQCGHCCRNLDYYDQLTEQDVNCWQALGRMDILKNVRRIRRGDQTIVFRMWDKPVSGSPASPCLWLYKIPTQNRWVCRIHDVRPEVCRQYPGSRKHADMTGCPGFE